MEPNRDRNAGVGSADAMAATIAFYTEVLNLKEMHFGRLRPSENMPAVGGRIESTDSVDGSATDVVCADLCFVTRTPIDDVVARFRESGIEILRGPILRETEDGALVSVYLHDPYRNLVEVTSASAR